MVVKQGYKQTDVGVIPEDWDAYPVGDIVNYLKGFPFRAVDYKSHGVRILRVSDTTYDQIKEEGIYIDAFEAKRYRKWGLRGGDLVVSTVGSKPPMYDSMVGKVTFISEQHAGTLLNQNAVVLRSESRSRQRMIQYNLRQERYISHIKGIFRGNANQASITLRELFDFQIPLPPTLAEQEAIAGALSDADAWIESLEQLIAKKRQIKQGAMQELLTGNRRLPGFSGEWETKRLGDVALLRNGYAFKSDTYAVLGSFKVVTIANVQDGRMEMAECNSLEILPRDLQVHHQLSVGDLLISMTGNVGRVCRVSHPNCLLNQRVGLVVPLSTSVEFLYNLLRQRFFLAAMARKAKGGAQGNLSKVDILEFEITIPNSLDEQQSIATVLSDMDTEIESLESKLAKAREIKQGMMRELLTGRIRLI